MSSLHRGPVVVGVLVVALVAGPAWAGHSTQTARGTGSVVGASLAAKKQSSKGTLAIAVSGSGSYTVTGKGFRKTGTASKSFKVKPGTYTIKAATGSVRPGKAKVRKGKTVRVTVTFATTPAPAPSTPPSTVPDNPVPTPPITPTPTPTPPPADDGAIQRVSTDAAGTQANDYSFDQAWSPDGTRVAFSSDASNLVPGDTNGTSDVFVKTLATGAVQRISTDSSGAQASDGSLGSYGPVWSPDGTRIAFGSFASNLVPGDTNADVDVFVKTLGTGAVQRISTDANGTQTNPSWPGPEWFPDAPVWSPDGTRVAFSSWASNLVPGDTNADVDVFVKTLGTGAVQRISTDAAAAQANDGSYGQAWSPDGTRIAFESKASNLIPGDTNNTRDIFVKTLGTGAVQRISTDAAGAQASDSSDADRYGLPTGPLWSPDGTRIAFGSWAPNLVSGDTNKSRDIFVKTLATGGVQCISTDAAGAQANDGSYGQAWSPDGTRIAFESHASNLVPGDTNNSSDVFVKTLG